MLLETWAMSVKGLGFLAAATLVVDLLQGGVAVALELLLLLLHVFPATKTLVLLHGMAATLLYSMAAMLLLRVSPTCGSALRFIAGADRISPGKLLQDANRPCFIRGALCIGVSANCFWVLQTSRDPHGLYSLLSVTVQLAAEVLVLLFGCQASRRKGIFHGFIIGADSGGVRHHWFVLDCRNGLGRWSEWCSGRSGALSKVCLPKWKANFVPIDGKVVFGNCLHGQFLNQ